MEIPRIRPAEWVVTAFVAYCSGRLALMPWTSIHFHRQLGFPSIDILFIVIALFVLKRVKRNPAISVSTLALIGLTLFSLQSGPRDINLPELHRFQSLLLTIDAVMVIGLFLRKEAIKSAWSELRDWWPPLAMTCFYPLIPTILASTGAADQDAALARIDQALFGGRDPLVLLEKLISLPLSEWMAFGYSCYLLLILAMLGALYLRAEPMAFRRASLALTMAFAAGYIGYTLVPAVGPVFASHFATDIPLHYMGWIKTVLMDRTRIERDCFPSLHTAITLILAWAGWKGARPLFYLFLPIIFTIPIACVYLRYHYVIDVIAGAVLSGLVSTVATFIYPATNPYTPARGLARTHPTNIL